MVTKTETEKTEWMEMNLYRFVILGACEHCMLNADYFIELKHYGFLRINGD